jgi:hypothetical protein
MTDSVVGAAASAEPVDRPGSDIQFDHWSSKIAFSPYDIWARLRNECTADSSS